MMRRVTVAVFAATVLLTSGCGETVSGKPVAVGEGGGPAEETKLTKLLQECDLVDNKGIAESVGGSRTTRGFFGAICRWDVVGPGGLVKVSFNWYETGAMGNERTTMEKLKYTITNITVRGQQALQTQRPGDGDSCGVTLAAPDRGIIGWWVQYRPGSAHPDPCGAAAKLAELSTSLSR